MFLTLKFTYTMGGWALIIKRKPNQPNKPQPPNTTTPPKMLQRCAYLALLFFVKPKLQKEQQFLLDGVLWEQLALGVCKGIYQAVKGAGIWSLDTATQAELLCKSDHF